MDSTLLPFAGFAFAASITPGPNNVMIAAIGARGGLRAAIAPGLGICCGFTAMLLLLGFGIGAPLVQFPWLHAALRWVGAAWIAWIAWQVATAPPPGEGKGGSMGFLGAALFQWVNPKA
jgi:threonine/homoserine/homoserine lactone efflux protein